MSEEPIEPKIEYDVDEATYELCVKVGKQLATDKDYFEICIKNALEQAKEENIEFTTA